jgi:hypothetical protein
MKNIFYDLLLICLCFSGFANAAELNIWGLANDFPMALPESTDWEYGFYARQIPSSNTDYQQGTHYEFDTIGTSGSKSYLYSSQAVFPCGYSWVTPFYPSIFLNTDTSRYGGLAVRPYPQEGCIAANPYANSGVDEVWGTVDDMYLDTYVRWIAPDDGNFKFDMGVFRTENPAVQIKISILYNGTAISGFDDIIPPAVLLERITVSAGDTIELRVQAVEDFTAVDRQANSYAGINYVPIYINVQELTIPTSWDITYDFPKVLPDFSEWELGFYAKQTTAIGLVQGEHYKFDTAANDNYDQTYSLLAPRAGGFSWMCEYAPAMVHNTSEGWGGYYIRPFGQDGCTAMNPWANAGIDNIYGTADDEYLDVYLRWTAPRDSVYSVNIGVFKPYKAIQNNATLLHNGVVIPGYDQVDTAVAAFDYSNTLSMTAGDTLELRMHAVVSNDRNPHINANYVPMYARITDTQPGI